MHKELEIAIGASSGRIIIAVCAVLLRPSGLFSVPELIGRRPTRRRAVAEQLSELTFPDDLLEKLRQVYALFVVRRGGLII